MLRTLIFISIVIFTVNLAQGQTYNYDHIFNEWKEGEIDINENVSDGGTRRGGWNFLTINKDSTVIYASAFTCGFGSKRIGTWTLDQQNNIITFLFKNTEGYINNPENGEIDLTKTYLIKKLNETELILIYQNGNPPIQIAFFANQ
ncbi:hypothetical protein KFE94_11945 [bacterium SCSIO 12643]|nr:hypothetical protein KFE94_11945 [bacterium SCSIO 12643]